MFLQGIGRKLPAQARAVENAARAVVDEGCPVDAAFFGMTEHHIHTFRFEQGDKLLAAVRPGKRGGDGLAGYLRQTLVSDLPFGKFKPALHGFIADGLADTGSLERVTGLVPGTIGGGRVVER